MHLTATSIVQKLQAAGFHAYFAGGCVRDMLLGKKPQDYDIATSAKPEEIEALFEKTVAIGKQFGVIMVIENGHHFEIATFRSDSGSSDGRRPDAVLFTHAEEDAKRRDFTINGMFYDPIKQEVLDYTGGQKDLKERLVHFIGKPEDRIQEDHLRILRAVRLVHQINGQYHPETYAALKKYSYLSGKVSAERARDELNKILLCQNRTRALEDLEDLGVLQQILPEVVAMKGIAQPRQYHHEGSVWNHMICALKSLQHKPSLELVWSVLLHDIGKPRTFSLAERVRFDTHAQQSAKIARQILERLHFSRKTIETVAWCVDHHMMVGFIPKMPRAKQAKWILQPHFPKLLALHKADASGAVPKDLSLYRKLKDLQTKIRKSLPKKIPKLLSGQDLIEKFGFVQGPQIGKMLNKVHEQQLMGKIKTRRQALDYVDRLMRKK